MQSDSSMPASDPIQVPTPGKVKAIPTRQDKAAAWELVTEIHEVIQGTSGALQELNHGAGNLLRMSSGRLTRTN
jgi:hypothetical protein